MLVLADGFKSALDILCLVHFLFGKEIFMKSANGRSVIVKSYHDEDAEKIVSLIIRNFREINIIL